MIKVVEQPIEPVIEIESYKGYVTKDGQWAAIPYTKSQYIIIHNGEQVHLARTLTTAKSYIAKQLRKTVK